MSFLVVGFYWYYTQIEKIDYSIMPTMFFPASKVNPINGTYLIGGEIFALKNGQAEKILKDNTKVNVNIIENPIFGNLNEDKLIDVAFVVAYSHNNSISYYIVAAIKDNYKYVSTNAVYLDDNIFHKNISIKGNLIVERYFESKNDLNNDKNEKLVYLQVVDGFLTQVIK